MEERQSNQQQNSATENTGAGQKHINPFENNQTAEKDIEQWKEEIEKFFSR